MHTDYAQFQQTVWDYYHDFGRDLPWRHADADGSFDPYKIMVSEIMLQQTQASRVVPKYHSFLSQFPTITSLAQASLADVLAAWSGLGYNRRAKFLWQAAQTVGASFPETVNDLAKLPGIGKNTAGAIAAYAYNQPVVFIETNIRTVYLHHFFGDKADIHDNDIMSIVEATVDPEHPREWYWALMDYGVYIKSTVGNVSRNSKHYAKQSSFHGSKRQIRGQVIRILTTGPASLEQLMQDVSDERLTAVLNDLLVERLIQKDDNGFKL